MKNSARILLLGGLLLLPACSSRRPVASGHSYPQHWWRAVPREDAASWEILPQDAPANSVILSKRHELGLLSNFAATPFTFRGKRYASLEGFWQMMKYPEGPGDPRTSPGVSWKHTRDEVAVMTGFEAKAAGQLASRNMQQLDIDWVTFEGQRITYRDSTEGPHYRLIVAAMWAKLRQNAEARQALLKTGDLVLLPDHHQSKDAPPAWRYHEILMRLRRILQASPR